MFYFEFEHSGRLLLHQSLARERPELKSYEARDSTVVAWLRACTVNGPQPELTDIDVPLSTVCERMKSLPKRCRTMALCRLV